MGKSIFPDPKMLIYANKLENDAADLIFFSPKEAQLLFRQLRKLSAKNIATLKCESRKTKCWVPSRAAKAIKMALLCSIC